MAAAPTSSPFTDLPRPTLSQRWTAFAYDPFLAVGEWRGMRSRRRRLLATAGGRVLEIGAGTGLNLSHYPDTVTELVLTEPDPGMARQLRRRVATWAGVPGGLDPAAATVVPAPAQSLPFPDASFDVAVTTMVLCTVPDPVAAVAELCRVVRPGGRLLVIEHVLARDRLLGWWQRRLHRPWEVFAAGCRADQDTAALLDQAGLPSEHLRSETWRGMPHLVHPLLVGATDVPVVAG